MTVTAGQSPTDFLEELLRSDRLRSQYSEHLDMQVWRKATEPRLADLSDVDARSEIDCENSLIRMSDFAAGVELVARGMLELARIDTRGKFSRMVGYDEFLEFPYGYEIKPWRMVRVLNPQPFDCSCELVGRDVFSSLDGELGLLATVLQAGQSRETGADTAWLGLVLAQRPTSRLPANPAGFTVVGIELTGENTVKMRVPYLPAVDYLDYTLGIAPPDRTIRDMPRSGDSFNKTVGFLNARNWLADNLQDIGQYLSALAERNNRVHICSAN